MKATGIVRAVDALGRIVVPKELRRSLGINVGDPVEFFAEGDCIVVKKYNATGDMEQVIDNLQKAVELKGSLLTHDKQEALLAKVEEMKAIVASKKN